jgi:hypothetical protein
MPDQDSLEPYLFYGTVLPERAPLSLKYKTPKRISVQTADGESRSLNVHLNIILNQIGVTVEVEQEFERIFDLRNIVKDIIQDDLALVGFIKGHAYNFEITRVINRSFSTDFVFGIDIPVIAERNKDMSVQGRFEEILRKATTPDGIYLKRCFSDLVAAMKDHQNSSFYCYLAIESLRNHCAVANNMLISKEKAQWKKFREVSGYCREDIERYKPEYADQQRHGKPGKPMSDQERAEMFLLTWDIVDAYLDSI